MRNSGDEKRPIVLIVDDPHRALQSLPRLISSEAFVPIWVPDEHEGLRVLRTRSAQVHIIIVDLKSSGMGGGGFLHQARQMAPHAAVLVTGPLGPFLYQGGSFYEFSGPSLRKQINAILGNILDMRRSSNGRRVRGHEKEHRERFGIIIGRSRSINEVYELIENLKQSLATVLIQGESGTGKELVARTIHQTSPRLEGPFVAINCGAIPATLMESELFGHEKGAFTGAIHQRKGKFEVACGGTLFLDEIGELDRELQVKLLRVLQEKEFQRIGGNATCSADVRIVAATSQDLRKAAGEGHFREDLFYRLNVVPVRLPPLRERREDIPLLLQHFLGKAARETGRPAPVLSEEAVEALIRYGYPGNVRELANVVERLMVLCPEGEAALRDLPEEVRQGAEQEDGSTGLLKELPEAGVSLKEVERELILKTLQQTSGNKQAAARRLGITRRLLYLRLSQYGLGGSVTSGDTSAAYCHQQ